MSDETENVEINEKIKKAPTVLEAGEFPPDNPRDFELEQAFSKFAPLFKNPVEAFKDWKKKLENGEFFEPPAPDIFLVGEQVFLNSGGPAMTVIGYEGETKEKVLCSYFHNGEFKTLILYPSCLTKI